MIRLPLSLLRASTEVCGSGRVGPAGFSWTVCRRLAQRRVILFFLPMRASSANQIFYRVAVKSAFLARNWPSRRAGEFFLKASIAPSACAWDAVVPIFAVAHGRSSRLSVLLGDCECGSPSKIPLRQIDHRHRNHACTAGIGHVSIMSGDGLPLSVG